MSPVPSIEKATAMPYLSVQGNPFLAIGAEVDFRNSIAPGRLEPLYGHAATLGCTTLFVPVLWSQVETSPGRLTMAFVDRQLDLARRHGLKLGLLWFGTNRGGSARFANLPGGDGSSRFTSQVPADVLSDWTTYRRAALPGGPVADSLCPACPATLAREAAAYRAFLRHLAAVDAPGTVVLVQVENEVSTPETGRLEFMDRCFCPVCSAAHAGSGLSDREFGDRSYAGYVAALVEAGAAEHPVPSYVNFVSTPRPGESVARYLELAPHLASCAPDVYAPDTESFRRALAAFAGGRNVPLVAETSSDLKDPSDRTVWYAVCEAGVIGFVLWAIDCACGHGAWEPGYAHRTPLVGPAGAWSAQASRIRDEFSVLARVMGPVCRHRGTPRMQWFVAEGAARTVPVALPGLRGKVEIAADGRGLMVLTGEADLTLAGHGFTALIEGLGGATGAAGRWVGDAFVPDGSAVPFPAEGNAVRIALDAPGVMRVRGRAPGAAAPAAGRAT